MIGNKQSCLEVINAEHMLTETCPWYRKESYSQTTSESYSCLHGLVNKYKFPVNREVTHLYHCAHSSDLKQIQTDFSNTRY